MNTPGNPSGLRGPLAAAGAALAMIACCALPALIAAGALTTVGAALRSWGPVAAAALLMLGAVVYVSRRRTRRTGSRTQDCCTPTVHRDTTELPDLAKRDRP
ncbi:MAG: hypothetical protein H5T78_08800 [Nocardia sp.]|nr:hypothetical protein [Nocardia sp.]